MPDKFDFSVFTHPRILYTERQLTPAGTADARATTDTNDLKASRDILFDYIWVGDDGNYKYSSILFNQSLLADLRVNWQIADRAPWFPQELVPACALQNWWDCDRTQVPTVPSFLYPQAVWFWRHTLRWVYNPAQQFRFDWQVRGSQGGGIPPGLRPNGIDFGLGMHGVSLRTGHRRLFGVGGNIPSGPGGPLAPPATGSFINPNAMGNISDEPYLIEGLGTVFDRQTWQNGDTRWLNWIYIKGVPTQGEPWSDVPIPLACYGIHQGIAQRGAFYKPPGGPILVKAGQSMVFQLENVNANEAMLAQIALIGRTAPGYGSLY